MKNYLLTTLFMFALVISAMGQTKTTGDTTLVDFETVQDPLVEPFDLTGYENAVDNPNQTGNTSDYVGKAVKNGNKFWGGINVYFGGDVDLSASDDSIKIDFYTEDAGVNDSILFKFQLFNRFGGVKTVEVDKFYSDADDTDVGTWKTLKYGIPDSISGSYNQMVIFFGWDYSSDGDVYYYDNVTVPGYSPYDTTEVTFEITDKFNNAEDVKLFIDGSEATLDQTDNVYTNTSSLASYNVTEGQSQGIYEIVYSHMAMGEEVRDTTSTVVGNSTGTQTLTHLIIVEEEEDGTAEAINVGDTPPTIDGTVDAVWDNAKTHTMQKRNWWGSSTGLYSMWKVMWDIDNVYLLYIIEDDTPHADNLSGDNVYINDNVETFFDMDQSASTDFDDNDWQIRTIRGSDVWSGSEGVTDTWAQDVERAQTEMDNNEGYIIEMAIPWESLYQSFIPIDGIEFNYDCVASDVTTEGGARAYRESWATSGDSAWYSTIDYGTITLVTKEDGDTAGFTINESDGSTATDETGTTDDFTVVLDAQPSSDVVIDVTVGDTTEGKVDKSSLTFTNGNWDTPQTVTVTGKDDSIVDGTVTYKITLSVDAASSDDEFDSVADQTVSVDNADDDSDDGDDPTGIEVPETLRDVRMYPNPAQKYISLKNLKEVKTVSIRNVLGATVKEVAVDDESMNINVEDLNDGIYFVIFSDEKENTVSLKLLKK